MSRRLEIGPIARIEGRANVTLKLGDDGHVQGARLHATEFRGFEHLCAGRLVTELPALTSRICGICPVSHALAAAKAGDVVLGAPPPPAARALRRIAQLAQIVQSHALSFFFLSSPDLVAPAGARPRSVLDVAGSARELVEDGVRLRRFGGETIERVAGARIHPAFSVPGGVARPLDPGARDAIRRDLPGALAAAERTLAWWRALPDRDLGLGELAGTVRVALVGPGGELAFDDGLLRAVSARGEVMADGVDPAGVEEFLAGRPERWTYAPISTWRDDRAAGGVYEVGPMARLGVVERCGTPRADAELTALRAAWARRRSLLHAHWARLVELVHALERIATCLDDPVVLEREVLTPPGSRVGEGAGACEAPRGTLVHRYRVDGDGVVTWASLLVPTAQNALAIEEAVRRAAERTLEGARVTERLAAAVGAAVRAFDPCLSCATHAAGDAPAEIALVGPGGEVLDTWPRRTDARPGAVWGG